MQHRPLGQSGIQASVVGLGTWAIGGWMWGGTDEAKAIEGIRAGIDAGMDFIDTAPIYGFGLAEEIVCKAIEGHRDEVVLATKCGMRWDRTEGDHFFNTRDGKPIYRYLGPDSMREEVERSLKRLGTDRIDLYQTHWQETTTPREETMAALVELKQQGKIRAIGVSNCALDQLKEYEKVGPVDSAQERYSMLDRKLEADLLPYCDDQGIAVLAYSPLGLGLLTGKVGPDRQFTGDDQRLRDPRFSVENRKKVAAMLDEFKSIAEGHGLTMAQLVIAWTAAQRGVTHALVGVRNVQQARENARAGDVVLSRDELATMDRIIREHAAGIP
jgi:aryl-alcohol dehydrogenase-like predicted oxidoreductase